ncbi:helix-turn-helix domain-containing protein, partial [Acinetobacter baumannii]
EHIRRYGPERVTVVAVAREAGMSHANVYRFFPSKAGLVDAVVVAWSRSVEMALGDIANAPDPADDKLERFLTAWAKAQRDGLDRDPAIYG